MKANKITLKKMRIEYLERIAGTLEYEIKATVIILKMRKKIWKKRKLIKMIFSITRIASMNLKHGFKLAKA